MPTHCAIVPVTIAVVVVTTATSHILGLLIGAKWCRIFCKILRHILFKTKQNLDSFANKKSSAWISKTLQLSLSRTFQSIVKRRNVARNVDGFQFEQTIHFPNGVVDATFVKTDVDGLKIVNRHNFGSTFTKFSAWSPKINKSARFWFAICKMFESAGLYSFEI